jgi:LPS export ABC transporter protein LptC
MSHKWLLTLAFLVIVGAGVAAVLYANNETGTPSVADQQAVDQSETGAQVVGKDVSFTITEADHKRWELHAVKAFYYPENKGAKLESVEGTLFNDKGEASATFTAPIGEFIQTEKKIFLSGGVVVTGTGEKPMVLQSPQLTWSPREDQVIADGGVQLANGDFGNSTATRCRFSMDFASVSLEGNAQTELDL